MNTSHIEVELLTDERIAEIEANNKLLKIFSEYIKDLEDSNPGLDVLVDLLFTSFMLGAIAVIDLQKNTTMHIYKEINELRSIFHTMREADKKLNENTEKVPS